MWRFRPLLLLLLSLAARVHGQSKNTNVTEAKQALDDYNQKVAIVRNRDMLLSWAFNTNITDYNQQQLLAGKLESAKFEQEAAKNLSIFDTERMDISMKREINDILDIGMSAQTDPVKLKRRNTVSSTMQAIYSTAKPCLALKECLNLEPGLTKLMSSSRDYDRLLQAWIAWRDASGRKMPALYSEFVSLSNEAIALSGYNDTGEYWRSSYEMDNFEEEVKRLFDEVFPLYQQLHAYARRKLKSIYGEGRFPSTGQIPAHLLGNMWAQEWDALADDLMPFKNKQSLDVTDELIRQNYTVTKIFKTADNFFQSLGLIKMPPEFWSYSMLKKPDDGREVVCHASAWDFYDRKNFRIKQCTEVNQFHFSTAHHEMGHIEYYLQYKNQPVSFREGANPGFHEAVGDLMMLSVLTPKHMQTIGLLKSFVKDDETDINFLMTMALKKVAFLPFGYLIDQWRWSVFRGDTTPDQYNDHWWNLRCKLQGVSPPVKRKASDFDPGAKYHVAANFPYIRYFVSFIIQFQFHQAACEKAGHKGPLHECDIYNSKEAGTAVADMLKLGSSKPWQDAMEQLTGQRNMSAQPLMEYFQPLLQFLKKENGDDVGWDAECPSFEKASSSVHHPSVKIVVLLILFIHICQRLRF